MSLSKKHPKTFPCIPQNTQKNPSFSPAWNCKQPASIAATPSLQPFRAPKIDPEKSILFPAQRQKKKKEKESFFLFHVPKASQSYNKTQPKSHTTGIFQPTKNLKRKLPSPKAQKATSFFPLYRNFVLSLVKFSAQINLNYTFPKTLLNKSCLFVLLFSCAKGFSQLTLYELPWVFMFMRYWVVLA